MAEKNTEKNEDCSSLQQNKVLECLNEIQETLECPLCFETDRAMIQCSTGHYICAICKDKIQICPFCKSPFTNMKCFLVEDVAKKLANLKVSLTTLDTDIKMRNQKVEDYKTCRKLIETMASKLSTFLYKTHDSLEYLSKYVKNPNAMNCQELERQLVSLTSDLHRVRYMMEETKHTLTILKK